MIACISCTNPHIKDYEAVGNTRKFEIALGNLTRDHRYLTYKMTDTVGDKDVGFAYYIDLKRINGIDTLLYNIRYEENHQNTLTVGLVGAFDLSKGTGGYGITANGMADIIKVFDTEILKPLSEEQHITIKQIEP